MITRFCVAGYRSLRDVRLALGPLTVVTGPNGSGKSSLYRALRLLADVAQGRVIGALAAEGGLGSTLWAGPQMIGRAVAAGVHPVQGTVRHGPVSLKLGFSGEDDGYCIDLGLPAITGSAFIRDPEIKVETLWSGPEPTSRSIFAARNGPLVRLRGETGSWRQALSNLPPFDSMITHGSDTRDGLELLMLRDRLRAWRFYDQFRTDRDAPARRPQIGTRTPVLADDGSDVAAAVQTIRETGDGAALDTAIDDAFPGASVGVAITDGVFGLTMRQPGLLRPLDAAELSDGTLRYLLLTIALLSPRPPGVMVLNEPEASLHPDLLPPLARLIGGAAQRSQVIVVTHAGQLVEALAEKADCVRITLTKRLGETLVEGCQPPRWTWPSR